MDETCAKCSLEFLCQPESIAQCQCNSIKLSPEELAYIASKFDTCLCANCLKELQSEYLNGVATP